MLPQWMLILSVFGFLILVIWIGRITSKWIESSLDFFVTGREISLLINACAIGGIGLSASVVAAMPMFSITLGFWPSFLFYGSMWAVAVIIYGLTIGGFIRRTGAYTISEWLGMRLSTKTRVICATCQLLGTISVMAANIAGISAVLVPVTGYPYVLNVLAITGTFLLYTFLGGMWAVTIVDVAHIIIGMPAYYIVISLLLAKTNFLANLPGADWRLYSLTGHMPLFQLDLPKHDHYGDSPGWYSYLAVSITGYVSHRLAASVRPLAELYGAALAPSSLSWDRWLCSVCSHLILFRVNGPPAQAWGQLVGHSLSSVMASMDDRRRLGRQHVYRIDCPHGNQFHCDARFLPAVFSAEGYPAGTHQSQPRGSADSRSTYRPVGDLLSGRRRLAAGCSCSVVRSARLLSWF